MESLKSFGFPRWKNRNVLHRPAELAALIGKVGTGTDVTGQATNQKLRTAQAARLIKATSDFHEGPSMCRRPRSVLDTEFLNADLLRCPVERPSTSGTECRDRKRHPIDANRLRKAADLRPCSCLPD